MHIMFTVELATVAGATPEWCPEHCNTYNTLLHTWSQPHPLYQIQ